MFIRHTLLRFSLIIRQQEKYFWEEGRFLYKRYARLELAWLGLAWIVVYPHLFLLLFS
jgi:hypothetical protein